MLNWKDDKGANVYADANWIKQNGMPVHTYKQLCTIIRLDWAGLGWTVLMVSFQYWKFNIITAFWCLFIHLCVIKSVCLML